MGLGDRLGRALRIADRLHSGLARLDEAAERLERRRPFGEEPEVKVTILGPDGRPISRGGPGGTQFPVGGMFGASTVAPTDVAGKGHVPGGPGQETIRLGRGDDATGGPGGEGVVGLSTNRDKIEAIVAASGVQVPDKASWDADGTGPGEHPGFIVKAVLDLGTSAPTRFLVWCAGWLAYGGAPKASARASRHGGGYRAATWGRDPRSGDFNYVGTGFMDRPGDRWHSGNANELAYYDRRGGQTALGQSGQSTSQGLTSTQARSIVEGTSKQVTLLDTMVSELRTLNKKVGGMGSATEFRATGGI